MCATRRALALAALVLSTGCAGVPAELRVKDELARGRYGLAAEAASEEGDELLRHLDRALVLAYAGDVRTSNLYFARAEQLAEERYTRSVSRAALSLLLNDTVLPYQPDPFERLLVPLYRGLNHVAAGEPADVAVEARKLSALLLQRRDHEPERSTAEGDAFLHAVAGVLLEWAGRPEDARVAYRAAAQVDSTLPRAWLPQDGDEAWRGGGAAAGPETLETGELVLLVEGGFVAVPVEERLLLVLHDADLALAARDPHRLADELAKRYLAGPRHDPDAGDVAYLLPIALPRRPVPEPSQASVTALLDGNPWPLPVAYDLSHAAALSYDRAFVALLAKTAARALAKTLVLEEATEDEDLVVRLLANALHVASEKADTRAWGSLPGEVRLLRVRLPEGRHEVQVRIDGPGRSRTLDLGSVEVRPGRVTLATARYY
ncbi:MAG: hypothetical protein ABR599_01875 [Gemmatimonadota bacterium]